MVENLPSCSGEVIHPRMKWNMVLRLARDVSEESDKAGIDPHQLVFVGGFAAFLHAKEVLGNKAVNIWRGTHDVDVVVTERGGMGKILAGLQKSEKYQYIDPVPSHFVDKQTWKIQAKPHGFLQEKDRCIDVDIYFLNKDTNKVEFNFRKISSYPDNFITQPVILSNLSGGFTKDERKIATPSILDCLIMKMDVATIVGKLRPKDQNDVLSLFMSAEKRGINESDLINGVLNTMDGSKNINKVKNEMKRTFSEVIKCYNKGNIASDRKIFIPSYDYLKRGDNTLK